MTVPRHAVEIEPGSILASRGRKKICVLPRRFALQHIVNDLPRVVSLSSAAHCEPGFMDPKSLFFS